MTTPTTPAADAVSLDDLAGQLLECIDDTPWITCHVAKSLVRSVAEELHMAAFRESALVAERDQSDAMRHEAVMLAASANERASALVAERDALRAAFPQWVSIYDARKPSFKTPVLVRVEWRKLVRSDVDGDTYEYGVDVTEGEYIQATEFCDAYFESYQGTHHDGSHVTHWMALPSAALSATAVEG